MLRIARKIFEQPWMTAPETVQVMAALQGDAAEPMALFVGGCVRNTLLDLPQGDIDIATRWRPEETTARLQAAGIKVVPTGIDHGTVTAVCNGKPFEITSLRKDVATDGRRAVVAFTQDWAEDAQRRDFTFNTLLCDTAGQVYDPTGQGIGDLEAGRVRFVGDAAQRIDEDYLRILRFFRFHAFYGKGAPDPVALSACRAAAERISTLSRERITQEISRIVLMDNPVAILSLMRENGVLRELFHEAYDPVKLEALCSYQRTHGWRSFAARLIVLADYDHTFWGGMEQTLIFTRALKSESERLFTILASGVSVSVPALKRLIYKQRQDIARQAVMLYVARRASQRLPEAAVGVLRDWTAPTFPVNGTDAIAAGITSGVDIGRALAAVEECWIGQDFQPDRAACLERLKTLCS